DVVIDVTGSGGSVYEGIDVFMDYVRSYLPDVVTVHHGHMPEITITSPTTATGIWSMEDRCTFPGGRDMNGFGHYFEDYEKVGGDWRIKTMKLTRLRVDVTQQ